MGTRWRADKECGQEENILSGPLLQVSDEIHRIENIRNN